mmetsp:Transcript_45359/g.92666  ORF Transcript_45359/g.92666 Transcript_45359/m.92666 type:complete len:252 (+) Transcript_45359:981-1736(+)
MAYGVAAGQGAATPAKGHHDTSLHDAGGERPPPTERLYPIDGARAHRRGGQAGTSSILRHVPHPEEALVPRPGVEPLLQILPQTPRDHDSLAVRMSSIPGLPYRSPPLDMADPVRAPGEAREQAHQVQHGDTNDAERLQGGRQVRQLAARRPGVRRQDEDPDSPRVHAVLRRTQLYPPGGGGAQGDQVRRAGGFAATEQQPSQGAAHDLRHRLHRLYARAGLPQEPLGPRSTRQGAGPHHQVSPHRHPGSL